jgi:hypothetical protein
MLSVIMLSVIMLSVIMLSVIMQSVIMQSVIMLTVIMLSVIMVSVIMQSVIMQRAEAPFFKSKKAISFVYLIFPFSLEAKSCLRERFCASKISPTEREND